MKVLIVDDEKPARDRLARMVGELQEHELVGQAVNGLEALGMAQSLEPDIVLLDIRMPGMDGIEASRHLNSLSPAPAIIFTTAYDEHALAAFDANAVGYLLKPIKAERLQQSLAVLWRHEDTREHFCFVCTGKHASEVEHELGI